MQSSKLLIVCLVGFILPLLSCHKKSGAQSAATGDAANVRTDSAGIEVPANLEKTSDLVKLQFVFKKGDIFGYKISNIEKVKITRDTNVEHSEQKVIYSYKFEALEPFPEGGGRLKATCLSVQFQGEYKDPTGSRSMDFNSESKNDKNKERMFAQYCAPVNTPFEIIVDHDGKVSDMRDLDAVIRKYMGTDYNTTKTEQRKLVERNYSETALKAVIQLAFQKFENKAIGIDSSWNIIQTANIGFLKVQNDAKYTLKGFQKTSSGKVGHIAIAVKSNYIGPKKLDTGQGMATISGFNVEGKGTTIFHMDKMRVVSRAMHQTVNTRFYIEPPEELKKVSPEQGKNFWMVQEATIDNSVEELHF